jgi:hypothetical protein
MRWTVAVIARIPAGATPIDDESADRITLRRDPPERIAVTRPGGG